MKKLSRVLLVLLMLVCSVFGLTACDKVTGIAIAKEDEPQMTFVLGQDLDLSSGFLTVYHKDSKKNEKVALNANSVKVSGYDKNTASEQELTISYEKQKTTLKVTVVPEIVVMKAENNYFVGDTFDKEKGTLRITRKDGTSFTADMSDENVSVEGFASDKAALPLELAISYLADDGQLYNGNFEVNVYQPDSVELTKPRKTSYQSHDAGIDLKGGYITFKTDKLTKIIELTEDMISGFDLTAATAENKETPLEQEVTITYAGQSVKYTVRITYSDVSLIRTLTKGLDELDWTGETLPEITKEQGENAIRALKAYIGLSVSYKKLITEEERMNILRTATVYARDAWKAETEEYKDVFVVTEDGKVSPLAGKEYAPTKEAYDKLKNAETPISVYSDALNTAARVYGDEILFGETTVDAYIGEVYDSETYSGMLDLLNYMLSLYDRVKDIPDDWTTETLANYKNQIYSALTAMTNSSYKLDYKNLYDTISSWRANDDLCDLLYTYYYAVERNDNALNALGTVYIPDEFYEVYSSVRSALQQMSYISQGVLAGADSTRFMWYYNRAYEGAYNIVAGENEMYKELYQLLTFSGLMQNSQGQAISVSLAGVLGYLTSGNSGYWAVSGTTLGDAEAEAVWDTYLSIYTKLVTEDGYIQSQQYTQDVLAMVLQITDLAPSKQYAFLASVNTYYRSGVPASIFQVFTSEDGSYQTYYTLFATMILDAYSKVLPESASGVFGNLMLAIEDYARMSLVKTAATETTDAIYCDAYFRVEMKAAIDAYATLDATDKAAFDAVLGEIYNKYVAIYNFLASTNNENIQEVLGDWMAKFAEIQLGVRNVQWAYMNITRTDDNRMNIYAALIAAYENTQDLVDQLEKEAPESVKNAYHSIRWAMTMDVFNTSQGATTVTVSWTLDYAVSYARSVYTSLQQQLTLGGNYLWNVYQASELQTFMSDVAYLMWAGKDSETGKYYNDTDRVLKIMADYRALSAAQKQIFIALNGATSYFSGVGTFFAENLTENAAAVADKLLNLELYYFLYQLNPEGTDNDGVTYYAQFKALMAEIKAEYEALATEDKEGFDIYAKAMYDYYLAKDAEMTTPPETNPEEGEGGNQAA